MEVQGVRRSASKMGITLTTNNKSLHYSMQQNEYWEELNAVKKNKNGWEEKKIDAKNWTKGLLKKSSMLHNHKNVCIEKRYSLYGCF